jgi:hypothetical protein
MCFLPAEAKSALAASGPDWFDARSITNFPVLYVLTQLYHDTSTFVPWRPHPKTTHFRQAEIVHHVV